MTVFTIAAIGGAFLAVSWSAPIWARVQTLQYLQFPWRTLFLPAFFMPLLALYAFQRIGPGAGAIAAAALVLFNLSHARPKGIQTFKDDSFSVDNIARTGITTTIADEFEPRWVERRPPNTSALLSGVDTAPTVYQVALSSITQSFRVEANKPARMRDSLFYYPGWTVLIDNRKVAIAPEPVTGEITFSLPAGNHEVLVELWPTPARLWARNISLASALSLISLIAVWAGLRLADPDSRYRAYRALRLNSPRR